MTYLGSTVAADCKAHLKQAHHLGHDDHSSTIHEQKHVRAILQARRKRAQAFDADLFADPAWDMLLELYLAHLGQFDLSVGSLCAASRVPATTALRWITAMERRGLFQRRPDRSDKRRFLISLSPFAADRMRELLWGTPPSECPI